MHHDFAPCVYILASQRLGRIYVGVTSRLITRIYQHREGLIEGHSRRYEIKRLVWFESHDTMETAILREKRIKKWNRAWKVELIQKDNPDWRDLAVDLGFAPLPFQKTEPNIPQ